METQSQERKYIRMTTAPVKPLVMKLAVPTIASMMVTTFYNVADTFFVGKLNNDSITSAVGVVFSLMAIIQATGFFFGHGSGNFISRELGKKNVDGAEEMASVGFFSAFAAGILILIFGLIFLDPLAVLLGSTPTVLPFAKQYMTFILIGAPYMTAQLVLNNQLRFQGNALFAMIGIVSGAVLNIGLDPLFIFVFDLGISGAAIATIISQAVSFCLLLIGVQKSDSLKIRFRRFKPKWLYFKNIFIGGFPSLCRQGLSSASAIVLNKTAGVYGDSVLAAFTVVQKVMMFANSALIGFGQGFQPVCGFNWGAKKYSRVREAFWFCTISGFVFLLVLSVVSYFFAGSIVALFRDSEAVAEVGGRILRAQLITFPVMSFVVLSNMMMQNIGKVINASILAMARQGLALIPSILILSAVAQLNGLIWAQPVADIVTLLVTVPLQAHVLIGMKKAIREGRAE